MREAFELSSLSGMRRGPVTACHTIGLGLCGLFFGFFWVTSRHAPWVGGAIVAHELWLVKQGMDGSEEEEKREKRMCMKCIGSRVRTCTSTGR